jgi:hypothetical protein
VERGQQDPAVQRVQVQVALELGIARRVRLRAVAGRMRLEAVLGAGAELRHVPAQVVLGEHGAQVVGEAGRQRDHAGEGLLGQHGGERRVHRRDRQRVAGERATHAARVRVVGVGLGEHRLDERVGQAQRARRDAAADRLADRQQVGLEGPRRRSRLRDLRRRCASRR